MAVRVPNWAGSGELILAGCGGFDAGEFVGSRRGGTLDPGDTEVGGGEDEAGAGLRNRSLVLAGGGYRY